MPYITENTMYAALSQGISNAQNNLLQAQNHATTGMRVLQASDDPSAAAQGTLLNAGLARLDSMGVAARHATNTLQVADGALRASTTLLARAKELAVQGANATLSTSDRLALSEQAHAVHDQIQALANTQTDGVYVFAGYANTTAPFASDGSYTGDSGVVQAEIAPNTQVSMNYPGSQVFTVAGGQNVLGMLQQLQIDLASSNTAGLHDAIGQIDSAVAQISGAQSHVGASLSTLQDAESVRSSATQLMQINRAATVEVDAAAALTNMLQSQAAYQSAIAQATQILTTLGGGLLG